MDPKTLKESDSLDLRVNKSISVIEYKSNEIESPRSSLLQTHKNIKNKHRSHNREKYVIILQVIKLFRGKQGYDKILEANRVQNYTRIKEPYPYSSNKLQSSKVNKC